MHFHLPKPLHGWREFIGEVGIIVVGILIALGGEQLVETWDWNEKVETVRGAIMGELRNNRARWDQNVAGVRCAKKELGPLDEWAKAGAAGPPPDYRAAGTSQLWTLHMANWTMAANSPTMDHFPLQQQLDFAALYNGIANRQFEIDQANASFQRIGVLVPLAGDLGERLKLREAIGEARLNVAAVLSNTDYMERHFDALGVKADDSDIAADIAAHNGLITC